MTEMNLIILHAKSDFDAKNVCLILLGIKNLEPHLNIKTINSSSTIMSYDFFFKELCTKSKYICNTHNIHYKKIIAITMYKERLDHAKQIRMPM